MQFDGKDKGKMQIPQTRHTRRLQFLRDGSSFSEIRAQRARLVWLIHKSRDISCVLSFTAEIVENGHDCEQNRIVLKIKYRKATQHVRLKFPRLDREPMSLPVFADSSHTSLPSNHFQLGFKVYVAYALHCCSVFHFSSNTSCRNTRFTRRDRKDTSICRRVW